MKNKRKTACDDCLYYEYNEEYEEYYCSMELDEDEMYRFFQTSFSQCPYYKLGDEYTIVKKQI